MLLFLFLLGLCVGSFLNVVALRYDGEHFVFDPRVINAGDERSHCPRCGKTLHWYELMPLISFAVQKGKCRGCGAKIGWQYPAVELLAGLIFVIVPWRIAQIVGSQYSLASSILWIISFLILLLISYIDIRLGIIPDELEIILGIFALGIAILESVPGYLLVAGHSFLGPYASVFGFGQDIWVSHLIGMVAAFAFFELLVLITRGKGMGMGDVKLALPLGFLFGWPDIAVAIMAAFVIGAIVGIINISIKKKTMGGTLPFGPFLALGAAFVFFIGLPAAKWYFGMMGL
ncbi:MAG: prepilin peptidase [Patescibacteria group bacterium]|nr:prepilin peptidase [Patescibacteria group bacterium]